VLFLWGSNAREAHPIFFHHVLKAVNAGAQLIVVDPRRTPSAQWADLWLGLDVGTDIPLANAVGREIIAAGLHDEEFIARATTGFDAYRASVEPWTLEEAERTLASADALIAPDADASIELRRLLVELTDAAKAIRLLAEQLDQHPESLLRGKKKEAGQ